MKKIMMMVVAAFMATVSANAQFEKGTWSLQPYMGGGIASVTKVGDLNYDGFKLEKQATLAYLTGVEAEYQFGDKFSAAAGLNYTSQGTAWDDFKLQGGTKINEIKAELGYIKIPLVVNYYIFKGFAVKTGIQFGFLVNSKFNTHVESKADLGDGVSRDADVYTSVSIKNDLEKFDFTIPIGVSYQFKVPIVIDARYQIGLTKVNKGTILGASNCKNSVFTLTVGYKFAL